MIRNYTMEVEDLMEVEDDVDILEIIDFGFPRRHNVRENHHEEMDDLTFFKRFRLRKDTVCTVLERIEHLLQFDKQLNNCVSPMNQLLTALRFYATGAHESSVADFMGIHQSTVSRIITKVSKAIANLRNQYIFMPGLQESIQIQNSFYRSTQFPRVIGCIDGTHIRIQSPGGEDGEVFRNRKRYFSINTQVVCEDRMIIRDIVARWPGSVHDSTVFQNSRIKARFEAAEFPNTVLIGDSAYQLKPYLFTPLVNAETRPERLYNQSQSQTRNVIERTFGIWKRRFPVVAYGLRCHLETTLHIIVATAILHNIACNMNEDVPPLPGHINAEEFEYSLQQGQIADFIVHNIGRDYRRDLINNYFANL